ncbi:hypothetical protein ACS0PU_000911 [Formica fusca]
MRREETGVTNKESEIQKAGEERKERERETERGKRQSNSCGPCIRVPSLPPSIYTFRGTRVIDLSDDTRANESLERDFTRNELRDHPSLPDGKGNLRPCRSPPVKDGPFDRDKMIPPPSFWPI